jgi:hypothetical protein
MEVATTVGIGSDGGFEVSVTLTGKPHELVDALKQGLPNDALTQMRTIVETDLLARAVDRSRAEWK